MTRRNRFRCKQFFVSRGASLNFGKYIKLLNNWCTFLGETIECAKVKSHNILDFSGFIKLKMHHITRECLDPTTNYQ